MKKKLTLSPDKQITGLCAGIADYFNIDPTIVRLLFLTAAWLLTFAPVVIAYLIASLIVPKADPDYHRTHVNTGKKIYRSSENKIFGGVCSGIAKSINRDPTVIRLLLALAVIFYGTGIFSYIVACIIIPKEPEFNSYNN